MGHYLNFRVLCAVALTVAGLMHMTPQLAIGQASDEATARLTGDASRNKTAHSP